MLPSVLIVDDDVQLSKNINTFLQRKNFPVCSAFNAEETLGVLVEFKPDVVVIDYHLPDKDGIGLFLDIKHKEPEVSGILITGEGSIEIAVKAMKSGFDDYLSKPLELKELALVLKKIASQKQLADVLDYYHNKESNGAKLDSLIGKSPSMKAVKEKGQRFLQAEVALTNETPAPVLITGETGTGKELVAKALHFQSKRGCKPFIEINCSAIPDNLLESELFGHERGAFTDAKTKKTGLFEAADGGTLFIDEIGDMAVNLQTKLLKAIEEKSVRRLGSIHEYKVDVRIITATNRDLEQLVHEGKFRSDLFFRIHVLHIHLPPLRERSGDVRLLANHFLAIHGIRYGKDKLEISEDAYHLLKTYSWPGNVRELANIMEQLVILVQQPILTKQDIQSLTHLGEASNKSRTITFQLPESGIKFEQIEESFVRQALALSNWNVTKAARLLGMSRDVFRYRLDKLSLKKPQ